MNEKIRQERKSHRNNGVRFDAAHKKEKIATLGMSQNFFYD